MKLLVIGGCLLLGVVLAPFNGQAEEFRNFLSYQGYTGILNVPNAEVADEGTIDLLYSNQIEPQWRDAARRRVVRQDNYILSVGALSHLEGALRLSEAPGRARDLSANFKLKMPWIPPAYPQLAVGIQDLSGGAPHLRSVYAVATQQWRPLRFSLGYGRGPDRLQGVFGGAELRLNDWLYLLAEHDTYEAAAGIRLASPASWPLSLALTLRTPLENGKNLDLAVALRIPLGRRTTTLPPPPAAAASAPPTSYRYAPPPPTASNKPFPALAGTSSPTVSINPPAEPSAADRRQALVELRDQLARHGFQDVRVGMIPPETCYLELENSRYNHNELDGLGVALGTAVHHLPDACSRVTLRLKNLNLPVLELTGPTAFLRSYFAHASAQWESRETALLREHLVVVNPGSARPADLELLPGVANPQMGRSALVVHPGLRTTVGTEVGVFDYRLSARTDLITRLWSGATFNVRADLPVSWSDNFRAGAVFNRTGHNDPIVDRVFLSQAFKLGPTLTNQIGGGLYIEDTRGLLNETIWLPGTGSHRFRARIGRFNEESSGESRDVWLGSYRYFLPALDLAVEGTVGQFFRGDQGGQLEVKRYFGDVAISALYTKTREQTLSFRITFPLTPRRDFRPGILQVRGTDRFGYQLNTVLTTKGGRNPIVRGIGESPQTMVNIEQTLHNSDRLHHRYLVEQLPRMRAAYLRYGTR